MIFLFGCAGEKTVEYDHFLDRSEQEVSERTVTPLSEPDALLNFSDYEIYSPGTLTQNSTHLFLIDFGSMAIVKVSKEEFENPEKLVFSEGSGPGELQSMQSLAVNDQQIYIGDPRQLRIVEADLDGRYIQDLNVEFSPGNLFVLDDNRLLNYNVHQQDHLFLTYYTEADTANGFEPIDFDFDEVMKYAGYLDAGGASIFYAGYSEPLLRKYSVDGDLLFSRATIDNYDTSDHYESRTMGETRIATFSDDALHSSMDVACYGEHLLVIPFHNGNSEIKYVDLYSASDGSYMETLSADLHPRKIAIDSDYLYVLARDGDDNVLHRYRNPVRP